MTLPQRKPPGPKKRFKRFFTVPITDATFEALENLKWRVHLDKTEIVRRFIDYLLTLPPDSQDKLIKSFSAAFSEKRVSAKKEEPVTTAAAVKLMPATAATPRPFVKRSGLP